MIRATKGRSGPSILTIVPYYLPGYRAGGPIRSVSAFVQRLSGEFTFRIVTGDRDAGGVDPYSDVDIGSWNKVGKARVLYLPPGRQTFRGLKQILSEVPYDLLYLNGFLHPVFSIRVLVLRRLGSIPSRPFLLAPRGHLSPGALSVKPWRKKIYLALAKKTGLCDGIAFHACSAMERNEIQQLFPKADIRVAPNLLPMNRRDGFSQRPCGEDRPPKESGRLRAIFLSRIAPKKNLLTALRACRDISDSILFSIVGPIDDEAYWKRCEECIDELPANVEVTYAGSVKPDRVPQVLASHHLFVLPTRSENFGHAILEALSVGLPVLISDQTPWTGVEECGAGWSCPVADVDCFSSRIREAAHLGAKKFDRMSESAVKYVCKVAAQEEAMDAYRRMFSQLIGGAKR